MKPKGDSHKCTSSKVSKLPVSSKPLKKRPLKGKDQPPTKTCASQSGKKVPNDNKVVTSVELPKKHTGVGVTTNETKGREKIGTPNAEIGSHDTENNPCPHFLRNRSKRSKSCDSEAKVAQEERRYSLRSKVRCSTPDPDKMLPDERKMKPRKNIQACDKMDDTSGDNETIDSTVSKKKEEKVFTCNKDIEGNRTKANNSPLSNTICDNNDKDDLMEVDSVQPANQNCLATNKSIEGTRKDNPDQGLKSDTSVNGKKNNLEKNDIDNADTTEEKPSVKKLENDDSEEESYKSNISHETELINRKIVSSIVYNLIDSVTEKSYKYDGKLENQNKLNNKGSTGLLPNNSSYHGNHSTTNIVQNMKYHQKNVKKDFINEGINFKLEKSSSKSSIDLKNFRKPKYDTNGNFSGNLSSKKLKTVQSLELLSDEKFSTLTSVFSVKQNIKRNSKETEENSSFLKKLLDDADIITEKGLEQISSESKSMTKNINSSSVTLSWANERYNEPPQFSDRKKGTQNNSVEKLIPSMITDLKKELLKKSKNLLALRNEQNTENLSRTKVTKQLLLNSNKNPVVFTSSPKRKINLASINIPSLQSSNSRFEMTSLNSKVTKVNAEDVKDDQLNCSIISTYVQKSDKSVLSLEDYNPQSDSAYKPGVQPYQLLNSRCLDLITKNSSSVQSNGVENKTPESGTLNTHLVNDNKSSNCRKQDSFQPYQVVIMKANKVQKASTLESLLNNNKSSISGNQMAQPSQVVSKVINKQTSAVTVYNDSGTKSAAKVDTYFDVHKYIRRLPQKQNNFIIRKPSPIKLTAKRKMDVTNNIPAKTSDDVQTMDSHSTDDMQSINRSMIEATNVTDQNNSLNIMQDQKTYAWSQSMKLFNTILNKNNSRAITSRNGPSNNTTSIVPSTPKSAFIAYQSGQHSIGNELIRQTMQHESANSSMKSVQKDSISNPNSKCRHCEAMRKDNVSLDQKPGKVACPGKVNDYLKQNRLMLQQGSRKSKVKTGEKSEVGGVKKQALKPKKEASKLKVCPSKTNMTSDQTDAKSETDQTTTLPAKRKYRKRKANTSNTDPVNMIVPFHNQQGNGRLDINQNHNMLHQHGMVEGQRESFGCKKLSGFRPYPCQCQQSADPMVPQGKGQFHPCNVCNRRTSCIHDSHAVMACSQRDFQGKWCNCTKPAVRPIPHIEMAFPEYLYDSPTRSNEQPVIADFMDYKVSPSKQSNLYHQHQSSSMSKQCGLEPPTSRTLYLPHCYQHEQQHQLVPPAYMCANATPVSYASHWYPTYDTWNSNQSIRPYSVQTNAYHPSGNKQNLYCPRSFVPSVVYSCNSEPPQYRLGYEINPLENHITHPVTQPMLPHMSSMDRYTAAEGLLGLNNGVPYYNPSTSLSNQSAMLGNVLDMNRNVYPSTYYQVGNSSMNIDISDVQQSRGIVNYMQPTNSSVEYDQVQKTVNGIDQDQKIVNEIQEAQGTIDEIQPVKTCVNDIQQVQKTINETQEVQRVVNELQKTQVIVNEIQDVQGAINEKQTQEIHNKIQEAQRKVDEMQQVQGTINQIQEAHELNERKNTFLANSNINLVTSVHSSSSVFSYIQNEHNYLVPESDQNHTHLYSENDKIMNMDLTNLESSSVTNNSSNKCSTSSDPKNISNDVSKPSDEIPTLNIETVKPDVDNLNQSICNNVEIDQETSEVMNNILDKVDDIVHSPPEITRSIIDNIVARVEEIVETPPDVTNKVMDNIITRVEEITEENNRAEITEIMDYLVDKIERNVDDSAEVSQSVDRMVAKIEGIESKSEGKDMNNTALKAKNTEHTLTEISHIINSVLAEVVDEIDKPSVTAENNMNIIPRVKDLDTFDSNVTKANVEDKTNKTSVDEAINTPMAVAQTFIKNIIASVENFLGPSVCDQKKKQIDNISSSNENLMDKKLTQSSETMSSLEKSMMETRESFLAATWNINVESNIMMINSGGTRRFNEKSMTLKISNFDRVQSNQKNLSTLINVEMNCTKQQEDVLNQFEELNRKLEDVKIEPSGSEVCVKDQSMECVPDYTPYYPDENEFNPVEAPEFKINPFECNALLAKYPSNPCTDIMPKIPNGNVPENSRTTFEEFTDSNVQESDDLDNIQIEKEDFGIINLAIDEYLQEEGKADQNIYQNGVSPSNTYTDCRYQMDTSAYQYTSNQQDSSFFMVNSVNPTYRNGFYDGSTIPNQLSMQQPIGKPSPYAGAPPTIHSSNGYFSQSSESLLSLLSGDSEFHTLFPNSVGDFPDHPETLVGTTVSECDLVDSLFSQVETPRTTKPPKGKHTGKTRAEPPPPQSPISIKSVPKKITIQHKPNENNFIRVEQSGYSPHRVRISKDKIRSNSFYNFDRTLGLGSPQSRTSSPGLGSPNKFGSRRPSDGYCESPARFGSSPSGYNSPRDISRGSQARGSPSTSGTSTPVQSATQSSFIQEYNEIPSTSISTDDNGVSNKSSTGPSRSKAAKSRSTTSPELPPPRSRVRQFGIRSVPPSSVRTPKCTKPWVKSQPGKPISMSNGDTAGNIKPVFYGNTKAPYVGVKAGNKIATSNSTGGAVNSNFVQTSSVDTNLSVASSSTIVPCVYKVYGCPARFSTSDILQHEFTCPYQCIKCPTLACKCNICSM